MLIIGLAGGSGSGKTSLTQQIKNQTDSKNIAFLSLDSYYHDHSELPLRKRYKINFDHPSAFDYDLLIHHLDQLSKGKTIHSPIYSFTEMTRIPGFNVCHPKPLLILEGLYSFYHSALLSCIHTKIYLQTDQDIRLQRTIERDFKERQRDHQETKKRFFTIVNPMHLEYVEKQKYIADYIINNNGNIKYTLSQLTDIINKTKKP